MVKVGLRYVWLKRTVDFLSALFVVCETLFKFPANGNLLKKWQSFQPMAVKLSVHFE